MAEDYYVFARSGRKYLQVQFRDPRTGKLGAAVSSGATSEAAAIRWAKKELKNRIVEAEGKPRASTPLGDYARPFFGEKCPYLERKRDEGKTYSALYVSMSRKYLETYLLPDEIATIPLGKLRRSDVLEWRRRLVEKCGYRRFLSHILGVLKVVLNEAVYNEIIDYSPASKVANPTYEKQERHAVELNALSRMLSPGLYVDPRHWMATVIAAKTGMRAGEIRALSWGQLDFKRGLILIDRAFKDQSSRVGPPKSGKPRVAPMSPGLSNLLQSWKKNQEAARGDKLGVWVLGYSENRALGYKQLHEAVRRAADLAGCPGVTMHYMRHTLNTYLRGAGVNNDLLMASFGWRGGTIQDNYSHPEMYDYTDQAKAIDQIILIGDDNERTSDQE